MQKKNLRLVLSGGGSGGHLTPSLAVAQEFLKKYPEGKVYFFISQNPLDESVIASSAFEYRKIYTGKLRRYFSLQNIADFFLFIAGIIQSLYLLRKLKIDVVFSKGGFVALPVALAAFILRIPIVAHESDTVQGLANRIIARFARKVCVTFGAQSSSAAADRAQNQNSRLIHTGTPIRAEILEADAEKGRKFLEFFDRSVGANGRLPLTYRPIILFMGASQGALQINKTCELLLEQLTKIANVVLISGKGKLLNDSRLQTHDSRFKQYEYLGEMFPHVLAASDMVISRAGANSLFELAALKKASVIIPLASAAGDHQRKNAKHFEEYHAIKNIDPELSQDTLSQKVLESIQNWIAHPEQKKSFQENIGKLFVENAAEKIVDQLVIIH